MATNIKVLLFGNGFFKLSALSKQWIKILDQVNLQFLSDCVLFSSGKDYFAICCSSWLLRAADKACTLFQVLLCCLIMEMEEFLEGMRNKCQESMPREYIPAGPLKV